jgi:hypothetical protein
MAIPYIIGIGLVMAAFVSGVAESMAHVEGDVSPGTLISARDLWAFYHPQSLAGFQFWVEGIASLLWDPVALTLMRLPAWLLLGGPGMALIWRFRPPREEDLAPEEDTLLLYDELAKRAHEEGYVEGDDSAPSHEERPPPGPDEIPDEPAGDAKLH